MTRTNNFDALRLVGAVAVIVGHAYHLLGRPAEVPAMLGFPISTLGVVIFFSISGYLITASWNRTRNPVSYFSARFLRIFPALIVVVALSVVALGAWFTLVPTSEYFGQDRTWSYFSNIWMRPQYDLPAVFTELPYPNAVNGSLWTLPAEFFCYLLVPVLCLWPRRLQPLTLGAFLAVALWLASIPAEQSMVVYGSRLTDAAGMWVFFAAGALLRIASEGRPGFFRTDVAVAAVAAYVAVISIKGSVVPWVAWAALPYAVLTLGLASTPYVRRAARFGDMSYGMYLWAFPAQQVFVSLFGQQRMAVNLIVVTLLSLGLAYVSWHVIEHPSLALKDRIVARLSRRPSTEPATRSEVTEKVETH